MTQAEASLENFRKLSGMKSRTCLPSSKTLAVVIKPCVTALPYLTYCRVLSLLVICVFKKYLFIYFGRAGSLLRHAGFLVVACMWDLVSRLQRSLEMQEWWSWKANLWKSDGFYSQREQEKYTQEEKSEAAKTQGMRKDTAFGKTRFAYGCRAVWRSGQRQAHLRESSSGALSGWASKNQRRVGALR